MVFAFWHSKYCSIFRGGGRSGKLYLFIQALLFWSNLLGRPLHCKWFEMKCIPRPSPQGGIIETTGKDSSQDAAVSRLFPFLATILPPQAHVVHLILGLVQDMVYSQPICNVRAHPSSYTHGTKLWAPRSPAALNRLVAGAYPPREKQRATSLLLATEGGRLACFRCHFDRRPEARSRERKHPPPFLHTASPQRPGG
jgi:hypothetical protein